jgi:hypothetical protein
MNPKREHIEFKDPPMILQVVENRYLTLPIDNTVKSIKKLIN